MKIDTLVTQKTLHRDQNSVLINFARNRVLGLLGSLKGGALTLSENGSVTRFGKDVGQQNINASIHVTDPDFYRLLFTHGTIGAGEAYFLNYWDTPDLTAVIRLMCRNLQEMEKIESGFVSLASSLFRLKQIFRHNSIAGSKSNIRAHYDLSNALYEVFLDKRMMYSSAMFPSKDCSLDEASEYKLRRIGEKLELNASDHVLEIGSGWGGLAIFLAQTYGCRVTTTTISDEQYKYAREKIQQHGLGHLVTVLSQDYRNLHGEFSKLVSVEMIEAVGPKYMPEYFSACDRLLKPGGKFLLQAITIPEQRLENYQRGVDFIQRYIFPGGSLPSVESILQFMGKHSSMQIEHLQDIGLDYAKTLNIWHKRFVQNRDQVLSLGFDDKFCRMWQFYLSYCEGGFLERSISTSQILLRK